MLRRSSILQVTILALLVSATYAQNSGQPPSPAPPTGTPVADDGGPGRGVARLSLIEGDVSVRRGDAGEVVAGAMNYPIMVSDAVMTGEQSRAEIQFDPTNMIRLGAKAEVRLSELEFHRYMLQIASGTVTFRVLRNNDASIEMSTPSVALRPAHRGIYRVSIRPDGTSEITVREGDIDVYTSKGSEHLNAGQAMLVRGVGDPEYQIYNAGPADEWDGWNAGRDEVVERALASENINPDITGAEDLDGNGQWVNDAAYGQVWAPTVSPDWAPYQNGRWVWEDYYGWTWVSYDTWGWAPYHYGRWFWHTGTGWCWWPGARTGHAYWRPALVGFFGFGGAGVGVGFGFGNVGWVPLAPYEAFHPWWGRGIYDGYRNSGAMWNNRMVMRDVNVANVYRNARVANSITAMNANQFGRAGVNRTTMTRPSRSDLDSAGLVRGQLPVAPGRASLNASDRMPRAGTSSVSAGGRFFQTRQPTAVNRVPFDQQRTRTQQAYRGTSPGVSTGAWRPVTPPSNGGMQAHTSPAVPSGPAAGGGGGWRRFEPGGSNIPSSSSGYPRSEAGNSGYARQPLRMNPSIVQPRSTGEPVNAQRTGYSQGYRPPPPSYGGGGASRPASAPRSAPPPPSRSSGGGGGHPSGGHHR